MHLARGDKIEVLMKSVAIGEHFLLGSNSSWCSTERISFIAVLRVEVKSKFIIDDSDNCRYNGDGTIRQA